MLGVRRERWGVGNITEASKRNSDSLTLEMLKSSGRRGSGGRGLSRDDSSEGRMTGKGEMMVGERKTAAGTRESVVHE